MSIAETLLPEFDREMGLTRRVLERVPDQQFGWKPHETSVTLGRLAEHLAEMPNWAKLTIADSGIDVSASRPVGYSAPATRAAVLALFDKSLAEARGALHGRTDAELMAPWTLRAQGKELFTMPKAIVMRTFVMNHMIHHRGQMCVYLRMNGVPVPSIYGPSGDEQP